MHFSLPKSFVALRHERLNEKTVVVRTNDIAPIASLARAKLAQSIVLQKTRVKWDEGWL